MKPFEEFFAKISAYRAFSAGDIANTESAVIKSLLNEEFVKLDEISIPSNFARGKAAKK